MQSWEAAREGRVAKKLKQKENVSSSSTILQPDGWEMRREAAIDKEVTYLKP